MRHIKSRLEVLDEREIELIHQAGLEILLDVGIEVLNPELRRRLKEVGCKATGERVFVPEKAIARMLEDVASTPSSSEWTMSSRPIRANNMCQTSVVEYPGYTRRAGTLEDVLKGIALTNVLPSVNTALPIAVPRDVPNGMAEIEAARLGFLYSKKPFRVFFGLQSCHYLIEMAELIADAKGTGRRSLGFGYSFGVVSPLRFSKDELECAVLMAESGWPASCYSFVLMGASSPLSLAGALAQSNAERLACLLLMWLWGEIGGYQKEHVDDPSIIDPSSMATSFAHPNLTAFAIANNQMCEYYGISPGGGLALSDAKEVDYQSGFERAFGIATVAFSGGRIGPSGIAGTDEGASLEKLVIEDAAISYVNWVRSGIEVNEESLAVDLIKQVGIGGSFLAEEHTVRYIHKEYWQSPLFLRKSWTDWEAGGKESIMDRAHEEVETLLSEHYPPQPVVSDEVAAALDKIVAKARRAIAGE